MNKKFVCSILLTASVLFFSCDSEDTYKMPDSSKDSTAGGGKKDTASMTSSATAKNTTGTGDTANHSTAQAKLASDNTKMKPPVKAQKKTKIATDSSNADNDANSPTARKTAIASADNSKPVITDNTVSAKPFVSKYGTLPRNATQDNITEFVVAFTDKTTFIKIYFDADPDDEMQGVKTQVLKALKKNGYNNISDQSLTLHPMHVPKDIHYELQHDGSVVIWIPPATTN